jgi:hypothetical protein
VAVARRHYEKAPRMVPVYGHAYLPPAPIEPYNPVFVRANGALRIGASCLHTYLNHEFGHLDFWEANAPQRRWIRLGTR